MSVRGDLCLPWRFSAAFRGMHGFILIVFRVWLLCVSFVLRALHLCVLSVLMGLFPAPLFIVSAVPICEFLLVLV